MTRAEVLVVGAGPAGIAAAVRASQSGAKVVVLDDNPSGGGQIWRGGPKRSAGSQASSWFRQFEACGARLVSGACVIRGDTGRRVLRVETTDSAFDIQYGELILATGARELFLPFPGWTLPNVTGVGGFQALMKSGLSVEGKRVVVGGSGPLLLAVAAYLRQHGAIVPAIVEQASMASLIRFGFGLAAHPGKLWQAATLRAVLGRTPYLMGSWIVAAQGAGKVERVGIHSSSGERVVDCDYAAVAYGLAPNIELAALLGCELRHGFVAVDALQRTNRDGIFCAGEATGIGGVDLSLVEGEIAGYAAAGRDGPAQRLFPALDSTRHFAANLNRTFALRPELRSLPEAGTLVCRCEDVPFGKLLACASSRAAKLRTRCGMGPCQGRVCGPATQFLFGWQPDSVRPPLFPARISTLLSEPTHQETTGK